MSKSSLITMLALIASVSAKPYVYGYGTLPYTPRAAYTAELYNPAAVASLSAAYTAPAFSSYSGYPAAYAPLSGAYSAPLTLPAAYSSQYLDELSALYNPVSSLAPVAPLTYASPYSYVYKR